MLCNITFIEFNDVALHSHRLLQDVTFNLDVYCSRHIAHNKIKAEQLHDFAMDKRIDR